MLNIVTQIDGNTLRRLLSVYSESMQDLRINFSSDAEMRAAYESFLRDFVKSAKHLILVEESGGEWVSALRAIETGEGRWFLEAVETKPASRQKGFGTALLRHTIDYLRGLGMTELTCLISKKNLASQALHGKCGFVPTDEPPLNCWGELEEGTVLYRLAK